MASEKLVEVWTDGGARPNPGPGGWGAVLRYGGVERELSGADPADHQQPHGTDRRRAPRWRR